MPKAGIDTAAPRLNRFRPAGPPVLTGAVVLLCVLMFSLFSTCASFFLLAWKTGGADRLPGMGYSGLALRGLLFLAGTLAAGALLAALRKRIWPVPDPRSDTLSIAAPWDMRSALILVSGLLFAALLILPRLDAWPWAAPDEVHHLTVARNLAVYGEYASGNPREGFHRFDPYDSVGPPVIVPVAIVWHLFGFSITTARVVIGLHALALLAMLYCMTRRYWGGGTAALALFLVPASFSTLYLARTLYGEVPAMAWFLAGLLAWQRAIAKPYSFFYGFGAGIAFGMAVLCKSIFVFTAFAFLAAALWDWLGPRQLSWSVILTPALGVAGVLLAWWAVQLWGKNADPGHVSSTLGVYQHYLLFGLRPFFRNLPRWASEQPLAHLVSAVAAVCAVPILFQRRYDPAWTVLFLVAVFFGLWWLFFTPGQLPRYYWPGNLVMALLTAPLLRACLRTLPPERPMPRRLLAAGAAAAIVFTPLLWLADQGREIFLNSEMRDDLAVAAYVKNLPPGTTVATSFPPLAGTLELLAGRTPTLVQSPRNEKTAYDVVIGLGPLPGGNRPIGRYTVREKNP